MSMRHARTVTIVVQCSKDGDLEDSRFVDQHAGRIALRPSQLAMFDGCGGRDGISVFSGQFAFGETYDDVINQLGKMSGTLLIAEMKVVEFRCVL